MKIPSCSVTCAWLTKSSRFGGRSERSKSSSAPTARASWMTTSTSSSPSSIPGVRIPLPGSTSITHPPSCSLRPGGAAQSRLHDLSGRLALGCREQLRRLRRRVAEVEQALTGERARVLLAGVEGGGVGVALDLTGDLLAQLDDDPLGGPLADAGDGLEPLGVSRRDRAEQLAHRAAG